MFASKNSKNVASSFLTFFSIYLCILKPALLPHANTQCPDVVAYLPIEHIASRMFLMNRSYNHIQVKKLTTGECASVLGQSKSAAHRRVGALQIIFWLSGEYARVVFRDFLVCLFVCFWFIYNMRTREFFWSSEGSHTW